MKMKVILMAFNKLTVTIILVVAILLAALAVFLGYQHQGSVAFSLIYK